MEQQRFSKRDAQAAATRNQLLDAAAEVFTANGYQATTVGAITTAAATAHGTFYLYFRNKEDAFAQVVQRWTLEMSDRTFPWPATADLREVLEHNIAGFFDLFVRNPGVWRCLIEGAFTTPSIEDLCGEIRAGFVGRAASTIREMIAAGLIREVDPELTANAFFAMVEWTATTQYVLRRPTVEASFEATAATLSDLWYHALAAEVQAEYPTG